MDELFMTYFKKGTFESIQAAPLDKENIEALEKVTGAVRVDDALLFTDEVLGEDYAELGDYVVSSMSTKYWPADKEVFESVYVKP